MRTKSEIEDRIRFLLVKELERRVRKATERLPHRCVHNQRTPLDTRKTVEDEPNPFYNRITMGPGPMGESLPVHQTIGLCMYYGEAGDGAPPLTICEDPIDAQRCPLFVPRKSKADLWEEFSGQIQNPTWLSENLPEVYGLMWVLDDFRGKIPWWTRLLYRLLHIRPEPVHSSDDLVKLLPPVE